MGERIIRMTQDLLDRGQWKGKEYTYYNSCFKNNKDLLKKNEVPATQRKNLNSRTRYVRACTRMQVLESGFDNPMPLVPEPDLLESGELNVDLSSDSIRTYGPQGLMLHSIGTSQSSAQANVNAKNKKALDDAVHAFVSPNDIVQCLPWNFRATHCAGYFNDTHIGVEMVEHDFIKKTDDRILCLDKSQKETVEKFIIDTYETAVELFAYLCAQYDLDPTGETEVEMDGGKKVIVPVILSHREGNKFGRENCPLRPRCKCSKKGNNCWASNHGDPEKMWTEIRIMDGKKDIGPIETNLTMDKFREDVKKKKGSVEFYFVTDHLDKYVSTGKMLAGEVEYDQDKKIAAGEDIKLNEYPLWLGKIDIEKGVIATPIKGEDERCYPKKYPLHKYGYRAAYNDLPSAIKAARIATCLSMAEGDTDKIYNVVSFGEAMYASGLSEFVSMGFKEGALHCFEPPIIDASNLITEGNQCVQPSP